MTELKKLLDAYELGIRRDQSGQPNPPGSMSWQEARAAIIARAEAPSPLTAPDADLDAMDELCREDAHIQRTHSERCFTYHRDCAIRYLLRELRRARQAAAPGVELESKAMLAAYAVVSTWDWTREKLSPRLHHNIVSLRDALVALRAKPAAKETQQ